MYTDPVYFLNGLLDELGHEQDAEEWSYDALRPGFVGWWTANNPDTGELLQVYVEHISADACGTSALTITPKRHVHIPSAYSRCAVCNEAGVYNAAK